MQFSLLRYESLSVYRGIDRHMKVKDLFPIRGSLASPTKLWFPAPFLKSKASEVKEIKRNQNFCSTTTLIRLDRPEVDMESILITASSLTRRKTSLYENTFNRSHLKTMKKESRSLVWCPCLIRSSRSWAREMLETKPNFTSSAPIVPEMTRLFLLSSKQINSWRFSSRAFETLFRAVEHSNFEECIHRVVATLPVSRLTRQRRYQHKLLFCAYKRQARKVCRIKKILCRSDTRCGDIPQLLFWWLQKNIGGRGIYLWKWFSLDRARGG